MPPWAVGLVGGSMTASMIERRHPQPSAGFSHHHALLNPRCRPQYDGDLGRGVISIAGVPESQLSRDVAAGLPDSAPGPPWDCRVSSVFWFHRAKAGAAEALPKVLLGSPRVAVTIGALIRCIDSPVGPYRELIAAPAFVLRPFPQANVAFIAVESEASVVGGRSNWALPKVLARFEGTIGLQGDAT